MPTIKKRGHSYLFRCYEAARYVGEKCGWTMLSCVDGEGSIISRGAMHEAIAEAVRGVL